MNTDFQLFPEQASTLAAEVDKLMFFALAVSLVSSLLIAAAIFYFFVRYRRRYERAVGADIHGSMALEAIWSFIPLVITMVLFGWGAKVYIQARSMPDDAREYFATGKQWMWKFQHPEGQREINDLHVPVGERIQLTMTSEDVIHSFYVPAFRVKQDVLPGRYTTVWFEATKTGTFHIFCAEYCGAEHSLMKGSIIVMEPAEYESWLASTGDVVAPAATGEALFQQYICHTCHLMEGQGRGPNLKGILGKEVELADGRKIIADEDYLRESILRSNAKLVKGYPQIMPPYDGQINEVGVRQLIDYIKSLEGGAASEGDAETSAPEETAAAAPAAAAGASHGN